MLDYPVNILKTNEIASGNDVYSIAAGENKHPVSFDDW